MSASPNDRACGPCQACCQVKEIPAAAAPARTRCRHQCAGGCAVYADRPLGCRRYTCAWVDGWGAPDDRPDLRGIIIEVAPGPFGGLEARAIEVWPGASDTARGRACVTAWVDIGARVRLERA